MFTFFLLKCDNNKQVSNKMNSKPSPSISKDLYGKTDKGESIYVFTLKNSKNISVKILSYGGIIKEINTPDKNGEFKNIVLGYDNLEFYKNDKSYLGSIIGRFANRIENGIFKIDEITYNLTKNNDQNHLHGGFSGFDKAIWIAKTQQNINSVYL